MIEKKIFKFGERVSTSVMSSSVTCACATNNWIYNGYIKELLHTCTCKILLYRFVNYLNRNKAILM